jgi:D-arginine dehydrogenase
MEQVDIAVVGGGIAGISVAYYVAEAMPDASVCVYEAEASLTHHTTGRSAAVFIENYGALALRPLTLASKPFYLDPPDHLSDGPLLTKKGYLGVARPDQISVLDKQLEEGRAINPAIATVTAAEAIELAPFLRSELVAAAIYEPDASDIDVAGLHQTFVRGFRANGGTIATTRRVDAARRDGDGWVIETATGDVAAGVIVNAAGAWGDVVATTAGVRPMGLEPKRRTAFMIASPFEGSEHWPLVANADHDWYANPDGAQFLCSPADETPSEPCDAKAEEIDIALAIERINEATTLNIRSVASSWAGLRTFSPDRSMIIGPDPDQPDFHWCVGQGGTGIQTAPGAGQLAADLIVRGTPGSSFDNVGLDLSGLLPDRLRS